MAALSTACTPDSLTRKRGDVSKVREGFGLNQVMNAIGKPDYIIEGQGLRLGWEEWVYPSGSVFFYRMQVKNVLKRSPGTPPPPKPKSPWDVPLPE